MSPKFLINGQGKDSVGEIFLEYRLGITDTGCGYPPHDTDRITIPVFVENVGGKPLYFRVKKGVIRIEPGERKRINGVGDEEYLPVPDDFDAEEAYAVVLLDFEDEFIDDKLLSQEEVNRLLNGCEEDGSSNYV